MGRPNFQAAWSAFARVNVSVAEVGKLIGGKVEANIADGTFANACPIRISYVLNETGSPMHRGKFAAVSGRVYRAW